jgi:hypothetical protein
MISQALTNLRPGATWIIRGEESYASIEWTDSAQTIPTEAEVLAEAARLKAEWENTQYRRDRVKAYPRIQDQLDMLYWDKVNGTDTWQQAIDAVKTQYPKPE